MTSLHTGRLATFAILLAITAMPSATGVEVHRSPISLSLSSDGSKLLTANQTSGTVSLIDTAAGKVIAEIPTGDKPAGVAISKDGKRGVVTHWYGYDLAVMEVDAQGLKVTGRVAVGPEPRGVVLSGDGRVAYVAVGASNQLVRVDLDGLKVTGELTVGREPRGLSLAPDESRLVVGNSRSGNVSLVDVKEWKVLNTIPIEGANLRQVAFAPDGKSAYLANMRNRGFATTRSNIDLGWVLGQRLTQVIFEGKGEYAAMALDPQGKAAGDAHGVAVSENGLFLAVGCGGTHEVMLFRTDGERLPWRYGNSRDLMPVLLVDDAKRFRRVDTGGRPTELAFAPDGTTLYVANYLGDSVQVINADSAAVIKTIALGSPSEISLERRGEILFHDAQRSFNQWYSCNTCHSDGHTNGLDFDTLNDGLQDLSTSHLRSRKKVPTLRRVTKTGPWTWHGWQTDLDDAMIESFTKSMQGQRPTTEDVNALIAYLDSLDYPRNPNRAADGSLTEQAKRGEAIFRSSKAACNACHGGPEFNDRKIHVVGLEEPDDAYTGYNPPSLVGTYDKDPYLHDGRSRTLLDALKGPHNPDSVTGLGELNEVEMNDLIAYLKSL